MITENININTNNNFRKKYDKISGLELFAQLVI